jgi:prepilin-type N-terminal cleavage/methylation domain-containing protein
MSMDKRRGFTLIELPIVVVIIGILASIAIPKFSATREKAFLSSLKTELKNLVSKQEIYHNTAFAYGNTLAAVGATVSDGVTITINEATGSGGLRLRPTRASPPTIVACIKAGCGPGFQHASPSDRRAD